MKENNIVSIPQGYRSSGREDMLEFMPTSYKTVLEIGCGEGAFSENLNQFVEYWGVEPDAEAIRLGRDKNSSANFLQGLFPSVEKEIPDKYFDVIVC
ncbi:class I SAM-dependent methyltransferase, partial [Vibrio breoganii]